MDSNQRRQSHQIYSLTRLSTSVHARTTFSSSSTAVINAHCCRCGGRFQIGQKCPKIGILLPNMRAHSNRRFDRQINRPLCGRRRPRRPGAPPRRTLHPRQRGWSLLPRSPFRAGAIAKPSRGRNRRPAKRPNPSRGIRCARGAMTDTPASARSMPNSAWTAPWTWPTNWASDALPCATRAIGAAPVI